MNDSHSLPSPTLHNDLTKPILVAGAAGFLGSNMVDYLLHQGHHVIGLDNYQVGTPENLRHLDEHPRFKMIRYVAMPSNLTPPPTHRPASPIQYQKDPIVTLNTAYLGTRNLLDLALEYNCRILLSSTSEIYGEPQVHPQPESYWGNVNPFGPRSCYDEGKRAAEALAYAYGQKHKMEIRIARIFNTYGPRMNPDDGRVVSSFINAALSGKSLSITGDGTATRSFQYVNDCLRGLEALMKSEYRAPVNIGNDAEFSLKELADLVLDSVHRLTGQERVGVEFHPRPADDPTMRRPDISLAKKVLAWSPVVPLEEGLMKTIQWHLDLGRP
ncbi:UDP-glucuronic acid decarboxylase 1 [Aspergillus hancockii]|nr:UDP-glucuronic acid decarboxylase 1 [Aspergillus hancockii]